MRYLLDTNAVSDIVRHPRGHVAKQIARVGEDEIGTSIVVAAELRYGAARKASQRLKTQLEAVLAVMQVLPLESPVDEAYAELRVELERAGRPIGSNDLLIAAQAKTLGCAVVTDNVEEFTRVPGLPVENWLRG
jgi:tRNA(fMet)-specific endonuclease VapC